MPACAAATASTVPIVMTTLACTLMRCVALQNTARSAVRSRVSSPRLDARLTPTDEQGEVDHAGEDEAEPDHLERPPPVPRPAHRHREAGQRTDGERDRQPAGERGRSASWCRRACSGRRRRRRSGRHPAARPRAPGRPPRGRRARAARCRRRSPATGCADPGRSPSAARARRRGTRPGTPRSPRGRRRSTRRRAAPRPRSREVVLLLLEGADDLVGDSSRTAGSLSMSVVVSANPCELANVRQLHTDTIVRLVSTRPTRMSANVLRPSPPKRPRLSSPTMRIVGRRVTRVGRRGCMAATMSSVGPSGPALLTDDVAWNLSGFRHLARSMDRTRSYQPSQGRRASRHPHAGVVGLARFATIGEILRSADACSCDEFAMPGQSLWA